MYLCQNRFFALSWRLSALLITVYAQLVRFSPGNRWKHFVYFTNQTNLMVLILFAVLTFRTARQIRESGAKGPIPHLNCAVQLMVVFLISITMIIYWVLLFNPDSSNILENGITRNLLAGFVAHTVSPLLTILDWILFMPHGHVYPESSFRWLCYPLLYCAFISLRAEIGPPLSRLSRYPYPFMDADLYSVNRLLLHGVTLFAGFWLLAFLYISLDRILALQLCNHYRKKGLPIEATIPFG